MSKRKRFLVTSLLLTIGFAGVQFLEQSYKFLGIGALSILTLVLFYWSLKEGLSFNLTLLSLILPFLFTLGVGFFWFLLPASIFTQVPILIFYGILVYIICLTENIFTVSAIRTIALLRAARGVGFVLTLLVSFLLFNTLLSLRQPFWISSPLVFFVSFLIFIQGLWQIDLSFDFKQAPFYSLSFVFSLILLEISVALFFWPATVTVGSLFLTVSVYVLLGLGQAKLEGRLFSQTIREYLMVGVLVLLSMFLATRWGE
jgi:hypothetical protein